MESKRLTTISPKRHIPQELCREILSRLPVKSLHRFRCVSKSWLSLINDPDFCHLHLHNFKNNRDETRLLVVEGKQRDCVVRCSDTFESSTRTLRSLGRKYTEGYWRILCSIDGLFLLEEFYQRDMIVVWSPSIRKFHHIPSLPEIDSYFDESKIGLGYDPLVKDYKFVKVVCGNADIPPLVAIYTLGTGSWKIIPFQGDWDYGYIYKEVVYLRGSLYFLATHRELDLVELVSFDLSSEMFSLISNKVPIDIIAYLFPNDYSPRFGKGLRVVRYGCSSLAVFDFESELFMWVWEIESMCWTKPYSLESRVHNFLYLEKNRDILMGWFRWDVSFTLFTRKRLVQKHGLVSSYNLETGEEKVLWLQKENADLGIYDVYGYIENLFPLK